MSEKYKNLKVKELQELLQKNGLPHTGKKEELIERLIKNDERKAIELSGFEEEFAGLEDFDESKLNLEELADPDLALQDHKPTEVESKQSTQTQDKATKDKQATASSAATTAPAAAAKASTKATPVPAPAPAAKPAPATPTTPASAPAPAAAPEEPKVVEKPGSSFKFTPITFDKSSSTTSTKKAMTEAEKKIERAKRFGLPLDEKVKKEARLERFGVSKPNDKPKADGKPKGNPNPPQPTKIGLDPEVLRKRAERFGLPVKDATLEEEKRKKRADRFGITNQNKRQKK